jgi:hypothetical protein
VKRLNYLTAVVLLLFAGVGAAMAQEGRPTPTSIPGSSVIPPSGDGAISGIVYYDENGDGRCGPGDLIVRGMPIRFVGAGYTNIYLQSGDDGSYALLDVPFGPWQVNLEPTAGWVATSRQTVEVSLSAEEPTATVNYCTATVSAEASLLPEAGASLSSLAGSLNSLAATLFGLVGVAALGLGLAWRRFGVKREG